jgi:hypothetical protein
MKKTMNNLQQCVTVLSLAVLVLATSFAAKAQPPADHPDFLRAIEDLRYARAHLQRPDGVEPRVQETKAIQAIDKAIDELKKAVGDDHKCRNNSSNSQVDAQLDWSSRLRRAIELVNKAHNYVAQDRGDMSGQILQHQAPQDIDTVRLLQHQALEDIDKARRDMEEAIHLVQ